MKSSFCIDLQRFTLIPTKFPLSRLFATPATQASKRWDTCVEALGHLCGLCSTQASKRCHACVAETECLCERKLIL